MIFPVTLDEHTNIEWCCFSAKMTCSKSIKLRKVQTTAQGYRWGIRESQEKLSSGQIVIILAGHPASANGNAALEKEEEQAECQQKRHAGRIWVVKTSPAARDLRNTVLVDLRFLFLRPPGWGLNSPINCNELHKASQKKGGEQRIKSNFPIF